LLLVVGREGGGGGRAPISGGTTTSLSLPGIGGGFGRMLKKIPKP